MPSPIAARAVRPPPDQEGRRERLDRLGARVLRLLHLCDRRVADLSADLLPLGKPTVAIVASLATYGVGYVARPIGAFVLGHWGDTHGRKNVLIVCMFMMGFSTMAVGLLPTYQQVGMLAPALLVVLRLIQGFAVAGEISGASSMILEHAPFGRRGFFSSFTLQGVQAGQILAAAVFLPLAHYMPKDAFNSWGWRIPFLLSFIVIIVGYIIRREVEETPAFAEEGAQGAVPKAPVVQAITRAGRTCCASSAWR